MRRYLLGTLAILLLALLGLQSCEAIKPGRVFAPEHFGMTCPEAGLCLEDPARLAEAKALRSQALRFVQSEIGPLKKAPRVLFCSTETCSQNFGMSGTKAYAVGTHGILIHPDGWQEYILRHEMIHHWQSETFGTAHVAHRLPKWYVEGMAYELSGDPRQPLPRADIEQYRMQFRAWLAAGNDWRVPPS
ncbi:hypothetical protein TRP8649_03062 [Pelagimonas phthalicica]|uniref:Peptidase MA superfamily protein n=1 Tax=Pelagimonas phthalicica TaxID=1037362 RepID=A0A238JFE2_9RHOB|nr:hypothetical protein [Pelagimonas phthalicica]TDS91884.1 hypothetical protein CLV87_3063 [Pelagimonas phthalicica]SMX28934.1 hypothetical protein TRP8649_03062 [Pelagimonas phthalicica]